MYGEVDQTAKINMVFFYCTLSTGLSLVTRATEAVVKIMLSVQWKNLAPPPPALSVAANLTHWEDGIPRDQRLQHTPFIPFKKLSIFYNLPLSCVLLLP